VKKRSNKTRTNNKTLSVHSNVNDYKNLLKGFGSGDEPEKVLEAAKQEIEKTKGKQTKSSGIDNIFKAMTLFEFDNGTLLMNILPECYKTFAVHMLRQLQKDYNCSMISERATAELATISYVRILDLQRRMNNSLDRPEKHDVNLLYISILGKELDRANRQYLAAIQTLRMIKQPSLQFNIKADTAVIGQNQLVHTNHE